MNDKAANLFQRAAVVKVEVPGVVELADRQLRRQISKGNVFNLQVDDEAHRSVFAVRTDINHGFVKMLVLHKR